VIIAYAPPAWRACVAPSCESSQAGQTGCVAGGLIGYECPDRHVRFCLALNVREYNQSLQLLSPGMSDEPPVRAISEGFPSPGASADLEDGMNAKPALAENRGRTAFFGAARSILYVQ